ncbi:MAG: SDR family NAD(P)-dependent oxidoreductase [Ruminococcaceae bacterium]|nr:SDR family NAD(P)-dependent oxidoreductase [Oscillospiraceae bacterium]
MNIALISGASRGIGLEFAKILDSYNLDELWLVCGQNTPSFEFKTPIRVFHTDLSEKSPFKKLKKALSDKNPTIKHLVCSAGVGFNGAFENLSEENIENTIIINCSALSLLTRIAIPYMSAGSKIIEIASGAGFSPQPDFAIYSASKSYVISFSRAIGHELSKKSISVTAVCPGPVDTDFFSNLENVKEYKKKHLISAKAVATGALKASEKGKRIYTPTFSIKLVHLASKVLPTSLILKFYK